MKHTTLRLVGLVLTVAIPLAGFVALAAGADATQTAPCNDPSQRYQPGYCGGYYHCHYYHWHQNYYHCHGHWHQSGGNW